MSWSLVCRGEMKMHIKFWSEHVNITAYLEDLDEDGEITLNCIVEV